MFDTRWGPDRARMAMIAPKRLARVTSYLSLQLNLGVGLGEADFGGFGGDGTHLFDDAA